LAVPDPLIGAAHAAWSATGRYHRDGHMGPAGPIRNGRGVVPATLLGMPSCWARMVGRVGTAGGDPAQQAWDVAAVVAVAELDGQVAVHRGANSPARHPRETTRRPGGPGWVPPDV